MKKFLVPGHRFCGILAIEYYQQLPPKFMFQNQKIGVTTSEPWKYETENGIKLMIRAAIFEPIENEAQNLET